MGITQFTNAIAAAATAERLIPAAAVGDLPFRGSVIHIEPWPSNTEPIYIGASSAINPTGFVDVIAILNPALADVGLRYIDIIAPSGKNSLVPQEIWVKASVNGEGVYGYYLTE